MPILAILALLVALLAAALFWWSRRQQQASGLPAGRVVYADAKPVGAPEKPLYDRELGLTGKPDYLVKAESGGALVPVEVKSARAPSEPHEGHVFQLLAYCLLVERSTGKRPPYGLLRYRNRTFAIDYTPQAEQELLAVLAEIRTCERRREIPRSHDDPHRCIRCGFRSVCDQRLGD
jgi:CRISPR-associated exonuclease Cas4